MVDDTFLQDERDALNASKDFSFIKPVKQNAIKTEALDLTFAVRAMN